MSQESLLSYSVSIRIVEDRICATIDRLADELPREDTAASSTPPARPSAPVSPSSSINNVDPPLPPQNTNTGPALNPQILERERSEAPLPACDPHKSLHLYRECRHWNKTNRAECSPACANPRFGPKIPAQRCTTCWRLESEEDLALILHAADAALRSLEANEPWSDQGDHMHDWICNFVSSDQVRQDIMPSVYREYERVGSLEFRKAVFSRLQDEQGEWAREQEILRQQRLARPLSNLEDLINIGPEEGQYRQYDFLDAQLETRSGVPMPALEIEDVVDFVYRDALMRELVEVADIRPIEGPWPPTPLPRGPGDAHWEVFNQWFQIYKTIREYWVDFLLSGRAVHVAHLRVARRRARLQLEEIRWESDLEWPEGEIYPQSVTDEIRNSIIRLFERPNRGGVNPHQALVQLARTLPNPRAEAQCLGEAELSRLPDPGPRRVITLATLEQDLALPCTVWGAPPIGEPDHPAGDEEDDEDDDDESWVGSWVGSEYSDDPMEVDPASSSQPDITRTSPPLDENALRINVHGWLEGGSHQ